MKMSHTPGPWHVETDGLPELNNQNNIVHAADGSMVVYGQANDCDARLIAAAPDLLEALIDAVEYLKNHLPDDMLAPHLAAIAKATGDQS